MKKNLLTFALFLFLVNLFVVSSCNDDDDDDNTTIRSVEFTANVTGDFTQSIDVTILPTSGQSSSVGFYTTTSNAFGINFIEGTNWFVNLLTYDATGINTGSYNLADPAGSSVYYNIASGAASGFYSTSGTLNITNVESTSPLGKATDRYVTGNFNAVFTTDDVPPQTVTVNGTFKDVFVLYN